MPLRSMSNGHLLDHRSITTARHFSYAYCVFSIVEYYGDYYNLCVDIFLLTKLIPIDRIRTTHVWRSCRILW